MRLNDRLAALERNHADARTLPAVVPETTTDAELEALRRSGIEAYRESDPDLINRFV
jgi:hypothetical protein